MDGLLCLGGALFLAFVYLHGGRLYFLSVVAFACLDWFGLVHFVLRARSMYLYQRTYTLARVVKGERLSFAKGKQLRIGVGVVCRGRGIIRT
jgi:hypothetical protein